MNLIEFKSLAINCIVCNSKMNCEMQVAETDYLRHINKYVINNECTRSKLCFGYISTNILPTQSIDIDRYFIGFSDIHITSIVNECSQIFLLKTNKMYQINYIPLETFLKHKGQAREKLNSLLILINK